MNDSRDKEKFIRNSQMLALVSRIMRPIVCFSILFSLQPQGAVFPEWIKILLSATAGVLVGFVSAFIFEPMKRRVEEKRLAKVATRAVYDELAAIYELLAASIAMPEVANETMFPRLAFDQFDYYYDHKRETFYRIPEWLTFVALVRECRITQDEVRQGKRTGHSAVSGMLDSMNIRKNADTDFRHLLDEGRGNFQSYAKTYEKPYQDWFRAMKSRSARL